MKPANKTKLYEAATGKVWSWVVLCGDKNMNNLFAVGHKTMKLENICDHEHGMSLSFFILPSIYHCTGLLHRPQNGPSMMNENLFHIQAEKVEAVVEETEINECWQVEGTQTNTCCTSSCQFHLKNSSAATLGSPKPFRVETHKLKRRRTFPWDPSNNKTWPACLFKQVKEGLKKQKLHTASSLSSLPVCQHTAEDYPACQQGLLTPAMSHIVKLESTQRRLLDSQWSPSLPDSALTAARAFNREVQVAASPFLYTHTSTHTHTNCNLLGKGNQACSLTGSCSSPFWSKFLLFTEKRNTRESNLMGLSGQWEKRDTHLW